MKTKMIRPDNENQDKLLQEIQSAFDAISCEAGLKERTGKYVVREMNRRRGVFQYRAFQRGIRWGVSVACLVLFLSGGLGGYQLYYAETATISIDVNPSIELEVNRWGKVVDEKTYGRDSEEVLSTVSLKHLEYEEALERLLGSEAMKKYLGADAVLTITVDNRTNDEQLMSNLQTCIDSALNEHHDGATAEYASVDGHMCQEAHSHGMSVGKYNAIQELLEEDPEATVEEFKNQSMKEIKMHMEHCEHKEDSMVESDRSQQERSGCSQHDGCSGGHHSQ